MINCYICHKNIDLKEPRNTYISATKYNVLAPFTVEVMSLYSALANIVICEECSCKIANHITEISRKVRQ